MARSSSAASPLYPKIRFVFTDHPITIWAGALLLRLYFELIGLRAVLQPLLAPLAKRSNNQIPVTDVLLAWFYGLALGAERFAHFTRYRRDPLLPQLLGLARFPSPDTLRRFFLSFTYGQLTTVSEALMRASLARMPRILLGHTLDLDSTVLCRYGSQEGSQIGYNPQKRGRPSHHPLLAFLSETRRLLWGTLRPGKAGPANGCIELLQQALTMLPSGHQIALVRADAGFFVTRFLTFLESRTLPYIIMARLTPVLRRLVIHRLPETAWRRVSPGIDVAETLVTLPCWMGQERRVVCLRQALRERPQAAGRRLLECPGYTYQLMVTSVPYAAEVVCRMYAGRADSENRIKELKDDLSLDTFCLQAFEATDAAFRLGCVAYNLLAGFRETVLPRCWFERRLRAVRDLVFLVGADLIPQGRRLHVRFAVPRAERSEFLTRLRTLSEGLPIAAQLEWTLTDDECPPEAPYPPPAGANSPGSLVPVNAQPPP
jgi:hypothetical protein